MASEGEADRSLRAHRHSYDLFIAMMKWGAIIAAVVTFLIVLIISD